MVRLEIGVLNRRYLTCQISAIKFVKCALDCSQPPYFSVGFSRPVRFVISERDLGSVSKLPRGAGVGVSIVGEGKRKNSLFSRPLPTPLPSPW